MKFPSLWEGLGEGRSYEALPKKDPARAESPRTQVTFLSSLP